MANVLLQLKLCFIEGYHERLADRTSQATIIEDPDVKRRRERISGFKSYDENDRSGARDVFAEPVRIIKTHAFAEVIGHYSPRALEQQKFVLMVRDRRDTLISYYHWQQDFLELDIPMQDFFSRKSRDLVMNYIGRPLGCWCRFYDGWISQVPGENLHVLSYEECMDSPMGAVSSLLVFMGIKRSPEEIQDALDQSTFEVMKRYEQETLGRQKVSQKKALVRHGKTGSWQNVLDNETLELFSGTSAELQNRVNIRINEQKSGGSGLKSAS